VSTVLISYDEPQLHTGAGNTTRVLSVAEIPYFRADHK
jgi:hypothetical protein